MHVEDNMERATTPYNHKTRGDTIDGSNDILENYIAKATRLPVKVGLYKHFLVQLVYFIEVRAG